MDRLKSWMKNRKGQARQNANALEKEAGTHVIKHDAAWLQTALNGKLNYQLRVWRTTSTNVMRFFIREKWYGRQFLRLLFWLEERFPRFFGEKGLYPLVVIHK